MTGASIFDLSTEPDRVDRGSWPWRRCSARLQPSAQITPTPFAATAAATPAGASAPAAENIEVTGSRLRTNNTTSAAPVTVITSKQIKQSSAQTIEDVLRKIPSIGNAGNFSTANNGGNGSSCIDLLNLGITRTLVLVDGRRFVHSPDGAGTTASISTPSRSRWSTASRS